MKLTKDIYTTREVAHMIGVETRAVQAAIKSGRLKADKFAGAYVITKEELKSYLEYRETRNNGRRTLD